MTTPSEAQERYYWEKSPSGNCLVVCDRQLPKEKDIICRVYREEGCAKKICNALNSHTGSSDERLFPVHPKDRTCVESVPWRFLNNERAITNHSQGLEDLAKRGGLDSCEIFCNVMDIPLPPSIHFAEANAFVNFLSALQGRSSEVSISPECMAISVEAIKRQSSYIENSEKYINELERAIKQALGESNSE